MVACTLPQLVPRTAIPTQYLAGFASPAVSTRGLCCGRIGPGGLVTPPSRSTSSSARRRRCSFIRALCAAAVRRLRDAAHRVRRHRSPAVVLVAPRHSARRLALAVGAGRARSRADDFAHRAPAFLAAMVGWAMLGQQPWDRCMVGMAVAAIGIYLAQLKDVAEFRRRFFWWVPTSPNREADGAPMQAADEAGSSAPAAPPGWRGTSSRSGCSSSSSTCCSTRSARRSRGARRRPRARGRSPCTASASPASSASSSTERCCAEGRAAAWRRCRRNLRCRGRGWMPASGCTCSSACSW